MCLLFVLIALTSCKSKEIPPSPDGDIKCMPLDCTEQFVFAVNKSSKDYKLFLNKDGSFKKDINVVVGENQCILDGFYEYDGGNITIEGNDLNSYLFPLKKYKKGESYLCLFKKRERKKQACDGIYVYQFFKNGKFVPFHITIDGEKKFEGVLTKKLNEIECYDDEFIYDDAFLVNKKNVTFIDSGSPVMVLTD